MRVLGLAVLSILLAIPAASAQDWDCGDPGNLPQQGMNYCAVLDYEAADRALNVAWGLVKPKLEERDEDLFGGGRPAAESLLEAQRAWLTYRDAQCETEGYTFRGGSLAPFIVSTCKTHLTQMRTQELLLLIEEY